MFLEVSDNPHLSPKIPTSASQPSVFLVQLRLCLFKQLFSPTTIAVAVIIRLWNLWHHFALGPGCWTKQPTLILIVCSPPPPTTPFSLSPCGPRSLWQKRLAELIFKKKKTELVKRPLWSDPESSFLNPETKFLVR